MPLSLKDGVYRVRTEIGELDEWSTSNQQIITDLNFAAKEMCSEAQELTKYENLTLAAVEDGGTQEAALELEVDQVKAVKYFSGQLFDLEPHEWETLQIGASSGSIPLWYYIKTATRDLTPQSTDTSDILQIPIPTPSVGGGGYYTVIGVWPIPPEPAEIHVWYSYFHKYMDSPTSICAVPFRFLEGWASYAIARYLRTEKAMGEAELAMAKYKAAKEEYRIYASRQRNARKPARYGMVQEPWRQSASSSVIFVDPSPTGL